MRKILEAIFLSNKISRINLSERLVTYIQASNLPDSNIQNSDSHSSLTQSSSIQDSDSHSSLTQSSLIQGSDSHSSLTQSSLMKSSDSHSSLTQSSLTQDSECHSSLTQSSLMQESDCHSSYKVKKYKAHRANRKEKFRVFLFVSFLFFCSLTSMFLKTNAMSRKDVQVGIADEIIRFHVIANSDSNEDQELKIVVKNTLVKTLAPLLRDADSKEEARVVLSEQLDYIKELAEKIIQQQGYQYNVTVSIANVYFPLKIYGDYTFPPGNYDALRVQIGKAEGKNWWCVMFPPLCFVDETYNIVDEESDEKLKHVLTDDEYDSLFSKKTNVKVKFKLWEMIKDIFES